MCLYSNIAVPSPVLSIVSPTSVYAGSFVAVNCSIQLSDAVDSPVTVAAVWRKDGAVLMSSASRMVLSTVLVNSSLYLAQVVFRPVQLSTDDGSYACEVNVNAEQDNFVLSTRLRSNNVALRAAGMFTKVFI